MRSVHCRAYERKKLIAQLLTDPKCCPLTHTKRQATQHDCLPSLLGYGNKLIEKVYGPGENNYFVVGRLEQPRQDKNLFYRHDKPPTNQPRKTSLCTPWVPIHLCFNSQQRPTPLLVSLIALLPTKVWGLRKASSSICALVMAIVFLIANIRTRWWGFLWGAPTEWGTDRIPARVIEGHHFSPYPSRGTVPLNDILACPVT